MERRHCLDRHFGDHAKGANTDTRRVKYLGVAVGIAPKYLSVAGNEFESNDSARQISDACPGAMGCGCSGASQRLHVDIPQIRKRSAHSVQGFAERVQRDACLDQSNPRFGVDRFDSVHCIEPKQYSVSTGRSGKRMARSNGFNSASAGRCLGHEPGDALDSGGRLDGCRDALLVPCPIHEY